MRTINRGQGVIEDTTTLTARSPLVDLVDRHPCWYADYVKEDATWKIGVKNQDEGEDEEYTLIVDSNDVSTRSLNFALKLIDIFKEGGTQAIKKWVNKKL